MAEHRADMQRRCSRLQMYPVESWPYLAFHWMRVRFRGHSKTQHDCSATNMQHLPIYRNMGYLYRQPVLENSEWAYMKQECDRISTLKTSWCCHCPKHWVLIVNQLVKLPNYKDDCLFKKKRNDKTWFQNISRWVFWSKFEDKIAMHPLWVSE